MNRKKQLYQDSVVKALQEQTGKKNAFAVARLMKITINVGIGSEQSREAAAPKVAEQIGIITGQKAHINAARMSIASFKLREGEPVGVAVTLRGDRMWSFYDRLVSIVLPQVKDFSGVSRSAFDQAGNYSLGLREQIVFPEIIYDQIDRVRGLQITFTIRNSTGKDESMELLQLLGMPFKKVEENRPIPQAINQPKSTQPAKAVAAPAASTDAAPAVEAAQPETEKPTEPTQEAKTE